MTAATRAPRPVIPSVAAMSTSVTTSTDQSPADTTAPAPITAAKTAAPPKDVSRPDATARRDSAAPSPRLPAWARTALPIVLMLPCAAAGTLILLIPGISGLLEGASPVGIVGAFALLSAVTLSAYLLVSAALMLWIDRRPIRDLGLRLDGRALAGLLLGTALAVALALGAGILGDLTGISPRDVGTAAAFQQELAVTPLWAMIAMLLLRAFVLQGIGEEVMFRGYLMTSLARRPRLAVIIAAIAFTIPHLASRGGQQSALQHVLYLAVPFGFALSASMLALRMRSVWAAAGIHGGLHVGYTLAAVLGLVLEGPAMWILLGALHGLLALILALTTPAARWQEISEYGPYAR